MTPVLDAVRREELRKLAEAATPGPWAAVPKEDGAEEVEITSPYPGLPREPLYIAQTFGMADECGSASANAAHIAANSPSTTLALLAYIAELEAGLAEAEEVVAKYWDAIDMMNDGPDDSDVAYAQGQIAEAHPRARPIAERYRAALLPKASVREERG